MLITTVYADTAGSIHRRSDRGSNRRLLTLETEQALPLGARILGIIIVTEGAGLDANPAIQTPSSR
jgi:hypothetical protein